MNGIADAQEVCLSKQLAVILGLGQEPGALLPAADGQPTNLPYLYAAGECASAQAIDAH